MKLFWTAVIVTMIAVKLLLSFFVPALRATAEYLVGGFLLLVCSAQLFMLSRSKRE